MVISAPSAQKKEKFHCAKLAALRHVFSVSRAQGLLELNPAKLVSTPRREKKLPQHLSIEEAIRFMKARLRNRFGKRDRAMLELMYATGVRRCS